MNLFVMGLVLILTVSLGITLGVVSGYLIISGILNAFARKPVAANAAPALVHSVAGD